MSPHSNTGQRNGCMIHSPPTSIKKSLSLALTKEFFSFRSFPEDFNKRILTELSENQLVDLHKEAMELFETYLKANAVHKVGVKEDLVRQIASSELFDIVIA